MSKILHEKNKIKILSLFSGCGGMDLGFHGDFEVLEKSLSKEMLIKSTRGETSRFKRLPKLNYELVFANDILLAAYKAWINYFYKRKVSPSIFRKESIVDLVKEQWNGNNVFPEADVVIGGFPCQDFSIAGKRKGFSSKKSHTGGIIELQDSDAATEENRGMLYMWMKHVIEIVKPKVFYAENVKGLATLKNVVNIITKDFSSMGKGYYILPVRTLYAPDYGVPQNRERVIFIGLRKDCLNKDIYKRFKNNTLTLYPEETHGSGKIPYVSCKDALCDLLEPSKSIDISQQKYSKARWYGNHCQGNKEISLNKVSPTIRAEHHGNIEFRRLSSEHGGKYLDELEQGLIERRLTVRECARLQTFPDDYQFVIKNILSASEGYKVIGNAVPPLLAYHLAYKLQNEWDDLFNITK